MRLAFPAPGHDKSALRLRFSRLGPMRPLVVAQLGCGYWGPNLLRNFPALPDCEVRYVVDPSAGRRAFVQRNFPRTTAVESCDAAFEDPDVVGVIIATPAATHFPLAKRALEAGKHVLVEKPLATTVAEVDALARCAERGRLVVMAGHPFIHNSPRRYVERLIPPGGLGEARHVLSPRLEPRPSPAESGPGRAHGLRSLIAPGFQISQR